MKLPSLRLLLTAIVAASSLASGYAGTIYTWAGTTGDLSLATNWSPTNGGPSAFTGDTAQFTGGGVLSGLTPNGQPFTANAFAFSGSAYSFASASPGDSIGIGSGTSSASLTASTSVNFSTQAVTLNEAQTWSISGNSTITLGGAVTTNGIWTVSFSGATNTLDIGNSSSSFTNLTITGWNGSAGTFNGTNDKLIFNYDPTSILADIHFNGFSGVASQQVSAGVYEVIAAVPEPSTWALIGVGCIGLALVSRRRLAPVRA